MYRTRSIPSHKSSFYKNNLRRLWLLAYISVLVLNSCSGAVKTTTDTVDMSFINSESCAPPCWYGLEIDKSTKADVLAILDQLAFVVHDGYREHGTVWNNNDNASEIQFSCVSLDNCGGAIIYDDKLKILWLRVGYDLTYKDTVDRLGAPDFIDYEFRIQGGCRVNLWWVERGIVIETVDGNSIDECKNLSQGKGLTPHRLVDLITYYSKEGNITPGDCCKRIDWPGFDK